MTHSQMNSTAGRTDSINPYDVQNKSVKIVDGKEYQNLLERSRRKDHHNVNGNAGLHARIEVLTKEREQNETHQNLGALNTSDERVVDEKFAVIINNVDNEKNSVEKLRIENDDRDKIFHDYSIAMEKGINNIDQSLNRTIDPNLVDEFSETLLNETVTPSNFTEPQNNNTDFTIDEYMNTNTDISLVPSELPLLNKGPPQSSRASFMKGECFFYLHS